MEERRRKERTDMKEKGKNGGWKKKRGRMIRGFYGEGKKER